MLNQTLNYLDHFARFTQKENVEAVERLLSSHKDLAKFERAQLGEFSFAALSFLLEQNEGGEAWHLVGCGWLTNIRLGSLCCENADEAKTLIPSLQDKIKDEDLQDLLDEISKLQNR